MITKPMS